MFVEVAQRHNTFDIARPIEWGLIVEPDLDSVDLAEANGGAEGGAESTVVQASSGAIRERLRCDKWRELRVGV